MLAQQAASQASSKTPKKRARVPEPAPDAGVCGQAVTEGLPHGYAVNAMLRAASQEVKSSGAGAVDTQAAVLWRENADMAAKLAHEVGAFLRAGPHADRTGEGWRRGIAESQCLTAYRAWQCTGKAEHAALPSTYAARKSLGQAARKENKVAAAKEGPFGCRELAQACNKGSLESDRLDSERQVHPVHAVQRKVGAHLPGRVQTLALPAEVAQKCGDKCLRVGSCWAGEVGGHKGMFIVTGFTVSKRGASGARELASQDLHVQILWVYYYRDTQYITQRCTRMDGVEVVEVLPIRAGQGPVQAQEPRVLEAGKIGGAAGSTLQGLFLDEREVLVSGDTDLLAFEALCGGLERQVSALPQLSPPAVHPAAPRTHAECLRALSRERLCNA